MVLESLSELLRADRIAWRMARWSQRFHDPVGDVTDPPLVCMHCEVEWPCAEWVKLDIQMRGLEQP
jgi:hypothetical protein